MKIKELHKKGFKSCGEGKWSRVSKDGKIYFFKEKTCKSCNELFVPWRDSSIFCTNDCRGISKRGENNPGWKGGKTTNKQGYVMVTKKEHPNAVAPNFRIAEHRLEMERKLGRYLTKEEHVHHLNGIKNDNRIENLVLITKSEHSRIHIKERWNDPAQISAQKLQMKRLWKNKSWRIKTSAAISKGKRFKNKYQFTLS